jgi:signal transduction histidine kinase
VAMEYRIDPALPERLIGDVTRLRHILFNLVGNALKFTDQGRIRLEVWPLKSANGAQDRTRILFSVTDTGIGIPEDKLDTLFKPFTQVDGSYTRKYQGAGLGLAIVKRLVYSMGGNISVDSSVGKGTTVYIVLTFTSPFGETGHQEQV